MKPKSFLVCVLVVLWLTGCASTTIDEAMPAVRVLLP